MKCCYWHMRALSLLFIAAIFVAGCDFGAINSSTQYDPTGVKTFRMAFVYEPKNFYSLSPISTPGLMLVFRELAHAELKGEESVLDRPLDLATLYEISNDGKQCFIRLRENAYFHNGDLMTADDVVYSIQKVLATPEVRKRTLNVLSNIRIKSQDKFTLLLTSDKREPWEGLLSTSILNANYEEKWVGKDPNKYVPMGTGPYKFVAYDTNTQTLKLERFDQYYNGPGKFEHIEIHYYKNQEAAVDALLKNEVDYFMDIPFEKVDAINANKNFSMLQARSPSLHQIFLNTRSPLLSDWRVRRALSLLIDRNELVNDKSSLGGQAMATDTPMNLAYQFRKPIVKPADAPLAMQFLTEAGWAINNGILMKGGQPFELELIYAEDNSGYISTLQAIANMWGKAGIVTHFTLYTDDEWFKAIDSGNYVASYAGFNESTEIAMIGSQYLSYGEKNYTGFSDQRIDELFHELDMATVSSKNDIRTKLQIIIKERAPIISLFYPKTFGAINNRFALDENMRKEPFNLYYIGNRSGR